MPSMEGLLHEATARQLGAYATTPHQALLLLGPTGSGKKYLAWQLLATLLQSPLATITAHPQLLHLAPEGGTTLSIDQVRRLHSFLQLKTTGREQFRRAVLISDAHTLTIEAQNALLKVLEEPPDDTCIILTASRRHALLPTILSRLQVVQVLPPTAQDVQDHFAARFPGSTQQRTQAFFLSGGMPGLMQAMLAGKGDHPLLQSTTLAKQLLGASLFERLVGVEKITQRSDGIALCEALTRIAEAGLSAAADKQTAPPVAKWYRILNAAQEALEQLQANGNTKLVLSNMILAW